MRPLVILCPKNENVADRETDVKKTYSNLASLVILPLCYSKILDSLFSRLVLVNASTFAIRYYFQFSLLLSSRVTLSAVISVCLWLKSANHSLLSAQFCTLRIYSNAYRNRGIRLAGCMRISYPNLQICDCTLPGILEYRAIVSSVSRGRWYMGDKNTVGKFFVRLDDLLLHGHAFS